MQYKFLLLFFILSSDVTAAFRKTMRGLQKASKTDEKLCWLLQQKPFTEKLRIVSQVPTVSPGEHRPLVYTKASEAEKDFLEFMNNALQSKAEEVVVFNAKKSNLAPLKFFKDRNKTSKGVRMLYSDHRCLNKAIFSNAEHVRRLKPSDIDEIKLAGPLTFCLIKYGFTFLPLLLSYQEYAMTLTNQPELVASYQCILAQIKSI